MKTEPTTPRSTRKRPVRIKIHDVAAYAGVSTKTVSRVLNNERYVRPETRARVEEAVRTLNYKPDISARSLAGHRSYMIALFYDTISEAYLSTFQAGAIAQCAEHRYHLLVERCENTHPDAGYTVAETAIQTRVDGVILIPPLSDNPNIIAALEEQGIPYVLVAPMASSSHTPVVDMDNVTAAYQLTQHLIGLGHRRIGFIQGHPQHSASNLRLKGCQMALREAGLSLESDLLQQGYFTIASGRDCARRLLSLDCVPTAIFACNDDMAAGTTMVARELGFAVPADISVVGFDNSAIAALTTPPLTTVRQPIEDMARGAVDLLMKANQNQPPPSSPRQYRFELVFRTSSGPPPT